MPSCHHAREEDYFAVSQQYLHKGKCRHIQRIIHVLFWKGFHPVNWIQTEATSFTSATPVSCLNHTAKFIMLNCFSHLLSPANSQLTFGRRKTSRTLNLECWWMLQGSDMDYLPAPPHPFPQVLQAAPHQLPSWYSIHWEELVPWPFFLLVVSSCLSPDIPLPASELQNYSGSKTSSTFPKASFSPQPRQKQLVT